MSRGIAAGWGRYRGVEVDRVAPADYDGLASGQLPDGDIIARGLGRSYGDAAQRHGGTVIDTTRVDCITWLDRDRGRLRAQAGVTIGDLIAVGVPAGWFVPVTPGTRQVTVGGAIAADIHGKNHHLAGSFGSHVLAMRLRLADDRVVEVSPEADPELFWATVGGMGLTGIIVDADIAMAPIASSTLLVETSRFQDIGDLMTVMVESDQDHDYSVAWVDLLRPCRSVLTQGSFARADAVEAGAAGPLTRPWTAEFSLPPLPPLRYLYTPMLRVLNEAWWRRAPSEPTIAPASITGFFHPLDAIADWNRAYGPSGFVQWQCVIPDGHRDEVVSLVLDFAALPSYLSVLKRMGPANQAPLSFPLAGWTLAVDLPATDRVLAALVEFDRRVVECGGRLYLAKDARMSRATFEASHPRLDEWRAVRDRVDPARRFTSDLAARLGL